VWRASTGVIHCVFDQIPNLQNCFTAPNKNLGGEGASDRKTPAAKVRYLGLESTSYLVYGLKGGNPIVSFQQTNYFSRLSNKFHYIEIN
jgi:hypothetical protein